MYDVIMDFPPLLIECNGIGAWILLNLPHPYNNTSVYSHTTNTCSTVMTYATSIHMNAPRKYNIIKTDVPDYLLAILSHYSSKSDGSCLVCLPSIALPRTFHAVTHPPPPPKPRARVQEATTTVRFLLQVGCIFFPKKTNETSSAPPIRDSRLGFPAAATPVLPCGRPRPVGASPRPATAGPRPAAHRLAA